MFFKIAHITHTLPSGLNLGKSGISEHYEIFSGLHGDTRLRGSRREGSSTARQGLDFHLLWLQSHREQLLKDNKKWLRVSQRLLLLPLCGFQRQQGPRADCHKPPRGASSPAVTASSFPSAPVWIPGLLPHPPLAQCLLRPAGPARNDGPWCGTSPALQWHWRALQICLLPQPPRN